MYLFRFMLTFLLIAIMERVLGDHHDWFACFVPTSLLLCFKKKEIVFGPCDFDEDIPIRLLLH